MIAKFMSILFACGLVLAPVASADASEVVHQYRQHGYHVVVTGGPSQGSLSQCRVLDVSGKSDSNVDSSGMIVDHGVLTTVHVRVSCNDTV